MTSTERSNTLYIADGETVIQDLVRDGYSQHQAINRIAQLDKDIDEDMEHRIFANNGTYVTTEKFVTDLQDLYGFKFGKLELYSLVK